MVTQKKKGLIIVKNTSNGCGKKRDKFQTWERGTKPIGIHNQTLYTNTFFLWVFVILSPMVASIKTLSWHPFPILSLLVHFRQKYPFILRHSTKLSQKVPPRNALVSLNQKKQSFLCVSLLTVFADCIKFCLKLLLNIQTFSL